MVNLDGNISLQDSMVTGNRSQVIILSDTLSKPSGSPTLTVRGTMITGNDDALAIDARHTTLEITDSELVNKGGGIELLGADAVLSGVRIAGSDPLNSARDVGGGIKAWESSLEIRDSEIIQNISTDYGGGIRFINQQPSPVTLTIFDSTLAENQAGFDLDPLPQTSDVLGGGLYALGGNVHITRSTFQNNMADRGGGAALWNEMDELTSVTIDHSTFTGNLARQTAERGGGGIFSRVPELNIENSRIEENQAQGVGGGIHIQNGVVRIALSTITGNNASSGGGVYIGNASSPATLGLHVSETTIGGNQATDGDGHGGGGLLIRSNTVEITESAITNNHSAAGGGGLAEIPFLDLRVFPQIILENATISGNRAQFGGGMVIRGNLSLNHVTLAANQAQNEGGGIHLMHRYSPRLEVTNSILAGNTSGVSGAENCFPPSLGRGSHSIEDRDTCGFSSTSALVNTDPLLEPLGENGGPTLTHTLGPGSPAVDTAIGKSCPARDQRGVHRPQGESCDIGAVEQR